MQQLSPQLKTAASLENGVPKYPNPIQPALASIPEPYQPPPAPVTVTPAPVTEPVIVDPNLGQLKGICRNCPSPVGPNHYDVDLDVYICSNCGNQNKEPLTMEIIEKEAKYTTAWNKAPLKVRPKNMQP